MTTQTTTAQTTTKNDLLVDVHTLSKFQKAALLVKSGHTLNINNAAAIEFTKRALAGKINGSSYIILKKEFGAQINDIVNNINLSNDAITQNESFVKSNAKKTVVKPTVNTDIKSLNWMEKTVKFPDGRGADSDILTGIITKVYTSGGVDRCLIKCGDSAPIMKRISTIVKYNN